MVKSRAKHNVGSHSYLLRIPEELFKKLEQRSIQKRVSICYVINKIIEEEFK